MKDFVWMLSNTHWYTADSFNQPDQNLDSATYAVADRRRWLVPVLHIATQLKRNFLQWDGN